MLDRLRNAGYTPKQYNELFMTITNELRHLDIFIDDLFSRDQLVSLKFTGFNKFSRLIWKYKYIEFKMMSGGLYERVQYTQNILPRLYLMVTVGVGMVKKLPHMTRDVLDDLVEMSRGVQRKAS